jgi:pyrimidine deaminase RibD-like protein
MPLPKAHRSDRSTKLKKAMPQPATEHLPADPDARFMHRALALARATTGLASPNPQVGCVLVRDGEIFAEGAHLYDAFDHAEIVALRHAEQRRIEVSGATAYVTLEPCSHHGRTGPCADALIQAGVARVVAATADPNPLVAGGPRAERRLRQVHSHPPPSGHPQGSALGRWNARAACLVAHEDRAALAYRAGRPR